MPPPKSLIYGTILRNNNIMSWLYTTGIPTCSNSVMHAATEAATDSAALACFHRHYSIEIFGCPPNLRGGHSWKKCFGWHKYTIGPDHLQKKSPLVPKLWTWSVGQDTEGRTEGRTDNVQILVSPGSKRAFAKQWAFLDGTQLSLCDWKLDIPICRAKKCRWCPRGGGGAAPTKICLEGSNVEILLSSVCT